MFLWRTIFAVTTFFSSFSALSQENINFSIIGNESVSKEEIIKGLNALHYDQVDTRSFAEIAFAIQKTYNNAGILIDPKAIEVQKDVLSNTFFIVIHELKVGSIRVDGKSLVANSFLSKTQELQTGKPIYRTKIQNQLSLFNDQLGSTGMDNNYDRKIRLLWSNSSQEPNTLDLTIALQEPKKSWSWTLFADNTGDKQTGNLRVTNLFRHSDVWHRGHIVQMSYSTSAENPDKVSQYGLSYTLPSLIMGDALFINAAYSNVDSGRIADAFDISGKGTVYGLHYVHVLNRTEQTKQTLNIGLDGRKTDNIVNFFGTNLGSTIESTPASLGYGYTQKQENRTAGTSYISSMSITYLQNAQLGQHNTQYDYEANRVGASVNWKAIRGEMAITYATGDWYHWLWRINGDFQVSNDPLISGEQFGIGGVSSVRGFRERILQGDTGYRIGAEVYITPPNGTKFYVLPSVLEKCQFYFFGETAGVSRHEIQFGERKKESIGSVGIGVNYSHKNWPSIRVDIPQITKRSASTETNSERIHASLAWQL